MASRRARRNMEPDERSRHVPRMFENRVEAGRALARALAAFEGAGDAIVLGLPRGGVPVAAEIARSLGLPLDVLVVRKLGLPWQPELAMGAVASGGAMVLNEDVLRLRRGPRGSPRAGPAPGTRGTRAPRARIPRDATATRRRGPDRDRRGRRPRHGRDHGGGGACAAEPRRRAGGGCGAGGLGRGAGPDRCGRRRGLLPRDAASISAPSASGTGTSSRRPMMR